MADVGPLLAIVVLFCVISGCVCCIRRRLQQPTHRYSHALDEEEMEMQSGLDGLSDGDPFSDVQPGLEALSKLKDKFAISDSSSADSNDESEEGIEAAQP